jgi:hypothetical protein
MRRELIDAHHRIVTDPYDRLGTHVTAGRFDAELFRSELGQR